LEPLSSYKPSKSAGRNLPPKKEQKNEQRHEESDKPLSLDATQMNSRHRGDNSGRLSQQRPTPTIIIIIR